MYRVSEPSSPSHAELLGALAESSEVVALYVNGESEFMIGVFGWREDNTRITTRPPHSQRSLLSSASIARDQPERSPHSACTVSQRVHIR